MVKREVLEVRHQFAPATCSIDRICGCYVDGDQKKVTTFKEAFLSLPEEEAFKYFEIFKKNLSGTIGKNLTDLEFPTEQEFEGGTQKFFMELRKSGLKDDELLDQFYDKVIENYDYTGNYLILLIHDTYDVPGKSTDGLTMDDASDEIYEYIMCCICHVNLSKPGLSYFDSENCFHDRVRDWVVDMPDIGFLFPEFNDRSADVHSVLYYTKKPEEMHYEFVDKMLGCQFPITANNQKETFGSIITEALGDDCTYETVKNIHDNLNELLEEKKDSPEPVVLSKSQIKTILSNSGVSDEKLENFDDHFDHAVTPFIPEHKPVSADASVPAPRSASSVELFASNITNTKSFEVKTPNVVIKVSPDRTDLIETKEIDGKKCIVIEITDGIEVNGIAVK